jgi:hypothetical protein
MFETAEDYLAAVVSGAISPDATRVRAAGILISYQAQKRRAPKSNPRPADLERKELREVEDAVAAEFAAKAALIRQRHMGDSDGNG